MSVPTDENDRGVFPEGGGPEPDFQDLDRLCMILNGLVQAVQDLNRRLAIVEAGAARTAADTR